MSPQQRTDKEKTSHFRGAIWVEDDGYNIVRFNGSYGTFHIDSWRMNLRPGVWLPAVVYSEEFDSNNHRRAILA